MKDRFAPLGALAALALILAFPLRGFVREVVIQPLLVVWHALESWEAGVPDVWIWLGFVTAALVLAVRSLLELWREGRTKASGKPRQRTAVGSWLLRLENAEQGDYSRWELAQDLARLTWKLRGSDEPLTLTRIRERVKAGELGLPAEVTAYLEAGMEAYRGGRHGEVSKQLELDPARVVELLEQSVNLTVEEEQHGAS